MPRYNLNEHTRPDIFPLPCSNAWGEDQYGLWVAVSIFGVEQSFRWCPPGDFIMGSAFTEYARRDHEIKHKVVLNNGFWLSDTVCTQKMWATTMQDLSYFNGSDKPVENISYLLCEQFLNKINDSDLGFKLRLPTEAEWEYACRAGTSTAFCFGENITTDQANFNGSKPYLGIGEGINRRETVKVKTFNCNDWGLYEMHGNVWEFCEDKYLNDISDYGIDPCIINGSRAVIRGGGWLNRGSTLRSAFRYQSGLSYTSNDMGFRFVIY